MQKIKIASMIVFYLLFFGKEPKLSAKEIKFHSEKKVIEKSFDEEIPFDLIEGQIILKVRINAINYNFLFDTGAVTIVDNEIGSLFRSRIKTKNIYDTNRVVKTSSIIKLDEISINNLSFENITAVVLDLSYINKNGCIEISGVIGADLMKNKVCQLNYQKKVLICSSKITNFKSETLDVSPIKFSIKNNGTPKLPIFFNAVKIENIILDTGFLGGVSLRQIDAEKIKYDSAVKSHGLIHGAFGSAEDTSYTFKCNNIKSKDGFIADTMIVSYRLKNETPKIGYSFLRDYITTIDWNNKQIYLKKISKTNNTLLSFGFTIYYNDGKLLVNRIYENSSAFSKGIKLYDQILKINNVDYISATQENYCDILKNKILEQDQIEILLRNHTGDYIYVLQRENILNK